MGGTFEVVPRQITQLFTISSIQQNYVIPVIYGILQNKRNSTHVKLFETIRT
jgi:hypothetical protein